MKVENHDKAPLLDLSNPEGLRPQGHAEHVEWVITDGGMYPVKPGTFHYYFTRKSDGERGVPFIQFDHADDSPGSGFPNPLAGKRIEIVNIASIVGIAYKPVD